MKFSRKIWNSAGKRAWDLRSQLWRARAALQGNGVEAHWWQGDLNFGDWITPLLLSYYGHLPISTPPEQAKLVAVGSVLDYFPRDYSGWILGSGCMVPQAIDPMPRAKVLAVRGEKTREKLKLGPEIPLGDPGLLASRLVPGGRPKLYRLGLVPHYADFWEPHFEKLRERLGDEACLIDARQSPKKVFALVDQCEAILSSSLHGLITAHAYGIPCAWVGSTNLPHGRFKFDDYFSSLRMKAEPVTLSGGETAEKLESYCRPGPADVIVGIQQKLDGIWRGLGERMGGRE